MISPAAPELFRRPTKVCVLIPDHWTAKKGGSEYQARILVERLIRAYDVQVTYLTLDSDPTFRPDGYRVRRFSSRRGLRRYGTFFDALRLYRALEREAPDVIYQQVGCAHTGIAAYYAKRHGCRMLWRVAAISDVTPEDADWSRPHRIVERKIFEYGIRNAGTIIVQSKDQKSLLSSNYGRSDAIVVRNFHPLPSSAERNQPRTNEKKRVIWVGNLKPVKNPEAYIRLAHSFSDDPDLEFVMIGASQGKPSWTNHITTMMRSASNLRYLGEQTQERINELLWNATAVVNTSHQEGFTNVFIQAWMRGVPVLSLNVNPDGLLGTEAIGFASGSEQQLHDDLAKLIRAPGLREAMGERARLFAQAEFSERNVAEIAELMGLERAKP